MKLNRIPGGVFVFVVLLLTLAGAAPAAGGPPQNNRREQDQAAAPSLRTSGKSPHTLLLAEGGRAALPIIIAGKASERTRAVAAELADYLKRITGARFDVKTGDGSRGIVLGTLAEFPDRGLAKVLAARGPFDGKEAFAIRTEPRRLRLIGATDLAASHAAFRFLELLGCRWFFPAPEWTVVPSAPTLRFDRSETDRPVLLARRIWYGFGFFYDPGVPPQQSRAVRDYEAWCRHNRMASSLTANSGHAWQTIILDNPKIFARHPEYLALVGGKRQTKDVNPAAYPEVVKFCLSNPGLRQLVTRWALDFLKKNPRADMVSLEPSDGGGHCECEQCRKLGSVSDRVFGLANEVARAVAKEHPGKMVGLYAYNEHSAPPSFPLEGNVFVQLTRGFNWGKYSFDELAELWARKCRNFGFYEYLSVWAWDFDKLPGGIGANVPYLRKQIPRYVSLGAIALDCESGNNWGPHGRGYYVANKLMWDPKADVDALLKDFYQKAFGPAAAPLQRYYERFDPGNQPLMGEHLLALAFRDLDEASRLARGRPDVQARLNHLKQYLRYVHLRWLLDHEKDQARRKELTLATLTHVYRTRHSYMNHWRWMEVSWANNAAMEFKEPSWAFGAPGSRPWEKAAPYTREETEKLFQEGLALFKPPPPVEEKEFSTNLVPVRFRDGPAVESRQQYQFGVPYAFYSLKGEPLLVEVMTSTTGMRNKPPARYTFRDAAGKKVGEGRLPLDNTRWQRLEVKVPRAGLYFLDFDDSGAGWGIKVASGRPCTILLQRGRGFMHGGWMQPMYFYLPKGTKQIQFYWSGGTAFEVCGPGGKVLKKVEPGSRYVLIDVPPEADGQVWQLRNWLVLGHLWFFNIPNGLAASPDALLIPREVARRDGLEIRADGGEK